MIKGLAITPPVVGRISIGRLIEKNGKRLPEKDDQFTLTSQVQNRDGWILHPLDEALRASSSGKLRSIPVRLIFDDPTLSLRATYTLFDRETGRPICVGNGERCRRVTNDGIAELVCVGPDVCEVGSRGGCTIRGRLNVSIGEDDELGSFIFRTTSYNSIRTLYARLQYFHAVCGGRLASLPLELKLRGKSTVQSYRTPIYYVDLVTRPGSDLNEAIRQARDTHDRRLAIGFDQKALDAAARAGLANGTFEETYEESSDPEESELLANAAEGRGTAVDVVNMVLPTSLSTNQPLVTKETLRDKLEQKAESAKSRS